MKVAKSLCLYKNLWMSPLGETYGTVGLRHRIKMGEVESYWNGW